MENKQEKKEIKVQVAERLAEAGQDVMDRVVDHLYEAEVKRRTDKVVEVMAALKGYEQDYKKLNRADNVTYDRERKPVTETFSKDRLDQLKALEEKIEKEEKKLKLAFEQNDWSKLLGG